MTVTADPILTEDLAGSDSPAHYVDEVQREALAAIVEFLDRHR